VPGRAGTGQYRVEADKGQKAGPQKERGPDAGSGPRNAWQL